MVYEKLDEIIKKCEFLKASRECYGDNWPKVNLILTKDQIKKIMQINDIKSLVIDCEREANKRNWPNKGIIGSTKYSFENPNKLEIQGSLTVLELMIEAIFG